MQKDNHVMYVDHRVDSLTDRLDEPQRYMDHQIETMHKRFDTLEALMRNKIATYSWSVIRPIPYGDSIPAQFPDRVVKFWHLKDLAQRRQLIDLLQFYHVLDEDETDLTFEEYVSEILIEAHARLAEAWNLNYPAIALEMVTSEQRKQQEQHTQREAQDRKRALEIEEIAAGYALRLAVKRRAALSLYQRTSHSRFHHYHHSPEQTLISLDGKRTPRPEQYVNDLRKHVQHKDDPIKKSTSTSPPSTKQSEEAELILSPTQRISHSSDSHELNKT